MGGVLTPALKALRDCGVIRLRRPLSKHPGYVALLTSGLAVSRHYDSRGVDVILTAAGHAFVGRAEKAAR